MTRADVYIAEAEGRVMAAVEAIRQAALGGENIATPVRDLLQLAKGIEAGIREGIEA